MLHDKSGALLMLNKDKRKLIKELLVMSMNSESVRDFIVKRLGDDYLLGGQNCWNPGEALDLWAGCAFSELF